MNSQTSYALVVVVVFISITVQSVASSMFSKKNLEEENIRLSKIIHEQQVSIGEYKANEGNPNMVK